MAKITQQSINNIDDKLKKVPDLAAAEREFTKKEAVAALKPTIKGLQKRGFTLEQVAALLRENGLDITFGSLRQYLADPKRKKKAPAVAAESSTSGTTPSEEDVPDRQGGRAKRKKKSSTTKKDAAAVTPPDAAKQTSSSFEVRPDTIL
jgi:hypothetical protein